MLKIKKKQRGFSMIEVLVSLLVIGIGLLGLSGLQIASVKGTNNAHSRNVATNLAMELSERMRANQLGVDGGFYENGVTCKTDLPSQCNTSAFCTPQQIAHVDVQEVMCGILKVGKREGGAANLLPNSSLTVDYNSKCDPNIPSDNGATDNNETTITIGWRLVEEHKDQQLASQETSIDICVIP